MRCPQIAGGYLSAAQMFRCLNALRNLAYNSCSNWLATCFVWRLECVLVRGEPRVRACLLQSPC